MAFSGNVPFPFGGGRDIQVNSSPLTHHDNMSVLRMLEWLRHRCEEITSQWRDDLTNTDTALRKLIADTDAADDEDRARIEDALTAKIGELRGMVDRLGNRELDSVLCMDPCDGRRDHTVSEALDDAYAEDRIFGWRAAEEDSEGLTAAQHDDRGWTAQHHDLWATEGRLNVLPGQYRTWRRLATLDDLHPTEARLDAVEARIVELEKHH